MFKKVSKRENTESANFDMVRDVIWEVLGGRLPAKPLTMDTRFDEIGFDSVRYINMLMCFEDIIDLDIDVIARQVDLSKLQTVGDAVRAVALLRTQT